MAWIKTIPMSDADERLKELMSKQRELYPVEYATPVEGTDEAGRDGHAQHRLVAHTHS